LIKAAIEAAFVKKSDGLRPIDELFRPSITDTFVPVAEAAA
jgi:hypothetical protein